jgi:hypothetical protein
MRADDIGTSGVFSPSTLKGVIVDDLIPMIERTIGYCLRLPALMLF